MTQHILRNFELYSFVS